MSNREQNSNNETIRAIMGRRSIRSFEPRSVEPEKVQILLECAFAAPSAMNHQPCHIMCIDSRELLDSISAVSERTRMAKSAPLAFAVCVDVARYEKVHQLTDGTWMADSACMMENILLAARALGLEGVWLHIVSRPDREPGVLSLLNPPEGVKVFALALMGYGAETKAPHSGVSAARLHRNGW
ncbi:MAG: nitroreductase family protein [Synergistaceae bacterium]|jgi:nitroreductase|nr:nitroreductase family protein [Synergistaceae bacterium]